MLTRRRDYDLQSIIDQLRYDMCCFYVFWADRILYNQGLRLRNEHPLRVNPVQFAYSPKVVKQCYGIVTGILSLVLM